MTRRSPASDTLGNLENLENLETLRHRRAWLFDLDGTLADTAPDLQASLQHTLRSFDYPPTELELIRGFVGAGARATIERALDFHGVPLTEAPVDEMFAAFLDHYSAEPVANSRLFKGADALLAGLAARQRVLACVTNKPEQLARAVLAGLGISRYFATVIGGDTLTQRKPHAAPLLEACRRLGASVDEAVMIGDSRTDVDAARNAGIPVVCVTFGYPGDLLPEDLGADALVESLDTLL